MKITPFSEEDVKQISNKYFRLYPSSKIANPDFSEENKKMFELVVSRQLSIRDYFTHLHTQSAIDVFEGYQLIMTSKILDLQITIPRETYSYMVALCTAANEYSKSML